MISAVIDNHPRRKLTRRAREEVKRKGTQQRGKREIRINKT